MELPLKTSTFQVTALLDSGSAGNFISGSLCRQLKLRTFPTTTRYKIHSITGESLSRKQVQRRCDAIYLQIGILHKERIQLLVLEDATVDIILGHPWLVKHDPILSWGTGEVLQWGEDYIKNCCLEVPRPVKKSIPNFIHEVLREFLHRSVIVYIDDILIYSQSEAEHRHHVAEVLQRLREHQLYLKAEKCSFHQPSVQFLGYIIDHQGVRMDEGKVNAVVSWSEPKTIKELQQFLGFANFYRRFIQNYSIITSALTNLHKGHPKTLIWNSDASAAFKTLKQAFTQAPLLTHPDPDLPFVVEVDASTTGIGAVLSQYHGTPARLRPCAYFSRKLSPAERNYDIGNRELLAIKLALEEWRHWLEGAAHPFQVLTDHKNLQYLRDAKRLCPRQARWALFFTRFQFTISYRPGSKNVRADALSRLFEPEETTDTPSNILPSQIIVSPIEWTSPPAVATLEPRTLPGCPPGRQFIPRTQRVDLIHTTHTSLGTGHPGANNTLSLISERFWWPNMARDVKREAPSLASPNRPWSHLGVDFMTDLPPSDGNTCILVIVDRFSKSCCLIPLKGLPTAFETAECLFNQVFRHYGIPEDIVSDRGPQFISRVWKAFFKLLGVTVSLSSGYHPQTNGQTERKIQDVGRFLRTFCHGHQNSWNQFLGWAEYAQNSLRQPSTGLTPF
ncbi:Transposon Tf2-9 polyprotein [Labeo rohita]|uniref:Gypsy retrotransposon integrase-like protein 1 n=1 Tax=Labeo rohita TaxID=84645 RepID=A0ABQ8LC26_LABRO|nr:Transposon Tf2-9 polyprotein [Labeo rohita]